MRFGIGGRGIRNHPLVVQKTSGCQKATEAVVSRKILFDLGTPAALVAVAMVLRWLLSPVLGSEVPFIFCWPAVVIAAWLGGFRAGFVATLLGALATTYFVMEPQFAPAVGKPAEAVGLALFVSLGTFLSWLLQRDRFARSAQRAAEALRQSEVRHRALAEQLAEADRHKNEFLAMLTHELRNPLAALRAAVELLTHCALADPDAAIAADILVRQADRLDRLTGDLLDLARISRGTLPLNREPVSLERIVRQVLEEVRPALQARRHELSVELPSEPVWLEADALRLVQVLVNLLDNAGKYTPPGGRISLAASREGDSAVLRVRDTGIGIPPDQIPRLFGLFTRLSATVDPTYSGLGIGLALVRNLVELHGGSVETRSEGRGKGSEFIVRLPVRPPPPVTTTPPPVESPAAPPCRVVLADDSDGFAASCARLLRRRGHEVFLAGDGDEAVKLVHEVRPDVLLLDIRLPGLDGYEVARRLRSAPGLEGVRIVGITGFGDEQHRREAEQAGFDELLTKPLRLADLERSLAGRTSTAAAT